MAGFTKLFSGIITSSIWGLDDKVLRVWVAMLALCDTDGVVEGSIPGFAHLARVTREELLHVVDILSSPDPDSRTPDHDGRRIEVIPGGWRVLNYVSYRDKGQDKEGSRAPYMRARRRKISEGVTRNTSLLGNDSRRTEAEAEAEALLSEVSEVSETSSSSSRSDEEHRATPDKNPDALYSAYQALTIPGAPWPAISREDYEATPGRVECYATPGWIPAYLELLGEMPDHEISPFLAGKAPKAPFNPEDFHVWIHADPARVFKHLDMVRQNKASRDRRRNTPAKPRKGPQEPRKAPAATKPAPDDPKATADQLARLARLEAQARQGAGR